MRARREGIEENVGTVATLMRPPGDPFHERLVAAYRQITRFLSRSIEAVELQAIDSAAPVLAAYHAPGKWLIGKPRTTHRPAEEVPLEVDHGRRGGPTRTTSRPAPSTAPPTLPCARPGQHPAARRDIYAPDSTRWAIPAPNCVRSTTGPADAARCARS